MCGEGYHVDILDRFYSMMLLCKIVGPLCTVPLKDQNSLIEQSPCVKYSNRAVKMFCKLSLWTNGLKLTTLSFFTGVSLIYAVGRYCILNFYLSKAATI